MHTVYRVAKHNPKSGRGPYHDGTAFSGFLSQKHNDTRHPAIASEASVAFVHRSNMLYCFKDMLSLQKWFSPMERKSLKMHGYKNFAVKVSEIAVVGEFSGQVLVDQDHFLSWSEMPLHNKKVEGCGYGPAESLEYCPICTRELLLP